MRFNSFWIKIAALAGIAACTGDIIMTLAIGRAYPGYNQLIDTMSKLGASDSPVGKIMSIWWVIMCLLFLIMASGFRASFDFSKKGIRFGFWLIVLYGLGEGMGSGIFPADHLPKGFTLSLIIHDTLGGIGIAGIILLPFVLKSQSPFSDSKNFQILTRIVCYFGPLMLIMFTIAKLNNTPRNFIFIYKGLWQRLLMLNYYIYLIYIAVLMWKIRDWDKIESQ
jgi:hypothetical protein